MIGYLTPRREETPVWFHKAEFMDYSLDLCYPIPVQLFRDFEDDFKLDRHAERQARNSDYKPNRNLLGAEYIAKQVRDGVSNPWLIEEVSVSCHEDTEAHNAVHLVERTQIFPSCCQGAQSRGASRIASSFEVQLFAEPAEILRLMIHHRERAAQEKQVASLRSLDVAAEGRGRSGELNAKFLQPLLCTGGL